MIFDDAPVEAAVEGIVNGIFFNQGHVCCAGSRLLVQESVADAVVDRLRARLGTLRLGDPLDNTDIGAINSRPQLDKIIELSAAGQAEGAQRWSPPCELPRRGYWFPPTVFTGVSQSHRIAREEIFGPVLSVLTFRTPQEAVIKANNTPYGLSAGVWTDKGSRILWMAQQLRAGVLWADAYNRFDPASPFGENTRVPGSDGGRSSRAGRLPRCLRAAARSAPRLHRPGLPARPPASQAARRAAAPAEGSLAGRPDRGRSGRQDQLRAEPARTGAARVRADRVRADRVRADRERAVRERAAQAGAAQIRVTRVGLARIRAVRPRVSSGKGGSGRGGSDQGDSGRAGPDQGGSAQSGSGKGGSGRGGSDQGDSGRAGPDQGGSGRGGSPDAGGPDRGGRIGVRKSTKLSVAERSRARSRAARTR